MKKLIYIATMLAFVSITSCKKYLEEPSRIQASITKVTQLQALLDNLTNSIDWTSQFAGDYAAMAATDDVEINLTAFAAVPSSFDLTSAFHYTFDSDKLIQTSANDPVWANGFQRILTANVILSNVETVSGTDEEKNLVRANAYFNRAYAYWVLVNHFCQPYSSSTLQTPGLPLRKTTSYTESLTRANLKDTYDFIMRDIAQAQTFVTYADVNPVFRWRISKTGIDAFLSRYYLFIGDYKNSLKHANDALASGNVELKDFNTIGLATNPTTYRPNGANGPSYIVNYSELSQWTNTQYFAWQEFYYTNFTAGLNTGRNTFNASQALLANYDVPNGAKANDLRYKHFMPDNSGFVAQWTLPGLNSFKQFGLNLIPTGPTIAEVLLNKAEASARLNDFITAGIVINRLRAKRFVAGYANVTLNLTADNALSLVLQERRRELPFAFRWYDLRRFAYNETPVDDIVVNRTFYNVTVSNVDINSTKTYTLPLKSTHYMLPIPNNDIIQSQGQIQQNTY